MRFLPRRRKLKHDTFFDYIAFFSCGRVVACQAALHTKRLQSTTRIITRALRVL